MRHLALHRTPTAQAPVAGPARDVRSQQRSLGCPVASMGRQQGGRPAALQTQLDGARAVGELRRGARGAGAGGRRALLCRAQAQATGPGATPFFSKIRLPSFGLNPRYKEDWKVALPADIVAGARKYSSPLHAALVRC